MNPNPTQPVSPYQPMLQESITRFLSQHRKGITDFTDFTSIFSRILHTLPDPPLQITWFYTALESRATRTLEPSTAAKDLFQLLASCSATCGSTKRIAVLAPLVFELCRLRVPEGKSEVENLVEGVVSYISILCGGRDNGDDGGGDDLAALEDLMAVWMVDCDGGHGVRVRDCVDNVKGFFPLVSDEIRKGIKSGCELGFLAGVVMCEVFLLKMCFMFEKGISGAEQEERLLASAVQTITGFRNFHFLDTLFRMMLEPVLPVVSLLGSENEVLLKEVLYNSVMVIDFSFINPLAGFSLHVNRLIDFAMTWLFVAELAVQSAREKSDQGKAMSYLNSFCKSCIPIQLIDWVICQSNGRKISRPNVSTPIALIQWLLVIEEQGFAVFGGEAAEHHARANFFTSRTECLLPVIKHLFNNLDKNIFLDSIHGEAEADKLDGDIEMLDNVDTVSMASDDTLSKACIDGTRKRKEGIEDDGITQLKYMRCQFHENSVRENSFIFRQQ